MKTVSERCQIYIQHPKSCSCSNKNYKLYKQKDTFNAQNSIVHFIIYCVIIAKFTT